MALIPRSQLVTDLGSFFRTSFNNHGNKLLYNMEHHDVVCERIIFREFRRCRTDPPAPSNVKTPHPKICWNILCAVFLHVVYNTKGLVVYCLDI